MSASAEGSDSEFVPEEEAEQGPALIKKLRDRLKKAVDEKQEYLDGWQRSRADFANFKREESSREGEKEMRAKVEIFEKLLPALDALELSVRSPAFEKASPEWQKGLKAVWSEFGKALERLGIEQLYPIGETVDHYKHEVLQEVAVGDTQADHTVVSVHRSGYKLGDTIIRPAQVSIGINNKHNENN